METLLVITIFLPLVGAAMMWPFAALGRMYVRWAALAVTLVTLVLTCVLVQNFPADGSDAGQFAVVSDTWVQTAAFDIEFSVGLDGLGLWLFAISAVLMVTSVLVSWRAITSRAALFYAMLLLLEFGCLGVFSARDIILFYVFFEFTLIPLFFLIGIWGSSERRYAAVKFFLFTLAGSLLTFLGLLAIVIWHAGHTGEVTFSIPRLTESLSELALRGDGMSQSLQMWIFVALMAGFAVKVPLFPFHTWLPLAHTEAPTAGSVFLAGILLKIGTYGFLRFNVPMLPDATIYFTPWILGVSAVGIIYGALVALAQSDMKRLIAYSSVSHLGFCMVGVFALNHLGVQGGTLQMVNHGISTGALFALIGMLYERYHTREIRKLGGVARRTPVLALFMLLFALSSIGLPGTNGFAGEFLLLIGMFQRAFFDLPEMWSGGNMRVLFWTVSIAALFGVVMGAWYMLWLVQRIFFGPLREPEDDKHHEVVRDLSLREVMALVPLAVLVIWIGVWPKFFLDRMQPTLNQSTHAVQMRLSSPVTLDSQLSTLDPPPSTRSD